MDYIAFAKAAGFTEASYFDPQKLCFDDAETLREACKADDCGMYGRFWTCPPGVGSIEKVKNKVLSYHRGLVLQLLTEAISVTFQPELFSEVSSGFNDMTKLVKEELAKEVGADIFLLGMSGCTYCKHCSYPKEKCRFVQEMVPCISGHCINVYRLWDSTGHRRADLGETDFYSVLLWNDPV